MAFWKFVLTFAKPVSFVIRGLQILLAMAVIGVSAVAYKEYSKSSRYIPGMVCGSFSLVIYVPLLFPPMLKYFTPLILFWLEILASIWWIAAFACVTSIDDYTDCSDWYYHLVTVGCQAGVAIVGIGVVGWVSTLLSIGLLAVFLLLPAHKMTLLNSKGFFCWGGIFPKLETARDIALGVGQGVEGKPGPNYAGPYPWRGPANGPQYANPQPWGGPRSGPNYPNSNYGGGPRTAPNPQNQQAQGGPGTGANYRSPNPGGGANPGGGPRAGPNNANSPPGGTGPTNANPNPGSVPPGTGPTDTDNTPYPLNSNTPENEQGSRV